MAVLKELSLSLPLREFLSSRPKKEKNRRKPPRPITGNMMVCHRVVNSRVSGVVPTDLNTSGFRQPTKLLVNASHTGMNVP